MARTKNTAPKISADAKKAPMAAPEAMFLLFTIVNKEKAEFYRNTANAILAKLG